VSARHHSCWAFTDFVSLHLHSRTSQCISCRLTPNLAIALYTEHAVTQAELERLKKRFMKLDRYATRPPLIQLQLFTLALPSCSDGSGSIDRDEFLSIPQIATNPLASRMIAIFDEE
jgi:Ca2+-binding EF-hand superfamily protein